MKPVTLLPIPAGIPQSADIPRRGLKAAKEFESVLIASLLQSLESTFSRLPGESKVAGSDSYDYLGAKGLADGISENGGFGIADLLTRYFASHESKPSNEYPSSGRSPN